MYDLIDRLIFGV